MTNDKNLMTVAKQEKTAISFKSAFDTLLPVKAIENERDAVIIYKTALAIGDKSAYKACKALAMVRDKKLFKESAKSFNEWAEKNGISKSAANARAKVGIWIDENGDRDIFADLRGVNFDYGTLVLLFEKTKGNADSVRELITAGRLPVGVTADDVRKLFKLNPANEVNADGTTTAEKPATDTDGEQTTEKTGAAKPQYTLKASYPAESWREVVAYLDKVLPLGGALPLGMQCLAESIRKLAETIKE